MRPGNTSRDDRPRPAGIPLEAYWDKGDNEWCLPERNAAGQFHGLVTWWRPDGTRCCATEHEGGKPHGKFTRYHENGEPSRTGAFVRGTLHGVNVFTRSTERTTEAFPQGLGSQIWRCEMDFVNGKITEGRLFDREGRRVMEDGTPFPTERPLGVSTNAHFRKPAGEDEYFWVAGETQQVGEAWLKYGVWRYWRADGTLAREEPYAHGALHGTLRVYDASGTLVEEQRYEEGERQFDRPRDVPEDATFDADDETWTHATETVRRVWTAGGVLRIDERYEDGQIVRLREHLDDGSLGQESTFVDGGVPRRKWFRRTEQELDSFPSVSDEHPEAREVEYQFDEHGMMTRYRITDGTGRELEHTEVYRSAGGDEEQERFATIDDASAAWIAEGERYTSQLNKWLHELYNLDEPTFEEPTFDRHDLERAVIGGVETLNARGAGGEAHAKFPLYYDGISKAFWDKYGLVVSRVLDTGREIYALVKHPSQPPQVMRITADAIAPVDGLLAFGCSHDKQYIALAYDDRIEIHHGHEHLVLSYPTEYDHAGADALGTELGSGRALGVEAIRVCPNGQDVLLLSEEGIYLIGFDSMRRLYPLDATMDQYVAAHEGGPFELGIGFVNADVSPTGDRITCGGMFARGIMAGLAIYHRVDDEYVLENTSQDDAFFPAAAVFHRSHPHVAFAACLYASLYNALANTTFRIDLDDLIPGDITEFGGGIARERGRVQTIASFREGFLLGFDNGYIRWMGVDDNAQLLGYLFVGGSILDIDVAADEQSFAVACDSGLVSRFVVGEASANLISTMPLADAQRVGFFRTYPPLRW
jgi:hypothetical protein